MLHPEDHFDLSYLLLYVFADIMYKLFPFIDVVFSIYSHMPLYFTFDLHDQRRQKSLMIEGPQGSVEDNGDAFKKYTMHQDDDGGSLIDAMSDTRAVKTALILGRCLFACLFSVLLQCCCDLLFEVRHSSNCFALLHVTCILMYNGLC